MKLPLKFVTITAVIAASATLASCTRNNGPTVTYGPITATGTLIAAENSLIRRGSHLLVMEGVPKYFVESRTQNMSELEGQTVFITGTLEANTTKEDLPVISATSLKRSHGDEDLHRFEIPALNIRLGVPKTWTGTIEKKVAVFMLTGETTPLLTIRLMSGTTLPPGGTSIFLRNRRGIRRDGGRGDIDIFILEKGSIIELLFDPTLQQQLVTEEDRAIVTSQFQRALGTISFLTDKDVLIKTTGSGAGVPCGGSAGVLCQSGYFCNITDTTNQIGQCKERQ